MKKNYKKPAENIVMTEFNLHILSGGSGGGLTKRLSEETKSTYGLEWDDDLDDEELDR